MEAPDGKSRKKLITNAYPESDADLAGFVFGETAACPKIIRFITTGRPRSFTLSITSWWSATETLHAATADTLGRMLRFIGEEPRAGEIEECVRFASIESMRALERETHFQGMGNRLKPGGESWAIVGGYKVRRAKVDDAHHLLGRDAVGGNAAMNAPAEVPT